LFVVLRLADHDVGRPETPAGIIGYPGAAGGLLAGTPPSKIASGPRFAQGLTLSRLGEVRPLEPGAAHATSETRAAPMISLSPGGLHSVNHRVQRSAKAMSMEKIFEYDLTIGNVTDYGVDMEALFAGREKVPLQGAQFDVTVAGSIQGRVSGSMQGIDYLRVRADGRRELDLRTTVETDDGNRIALWAQGTARPRAGEPIVDLSVKIHLLTAAAGYEWLNARPAWGAGYANLATGKIHIDAYLH
jgi:hypothetical protein